MKKETWLRRWKKRIQRPLKSKNVMQPSKQEHIYAKSQESHHQAHNDIVHPYWGSRRVSRVTWFYRRHCEIYLWCWQMCRFTFHILCANEEEVRWAQSLLHSNGYDTFCCNLKIWTRELITSSWSIKILLVLTPSSEHFLVQQSCFVFSMFSSSWKRWSRQLWQQWRSRRRYLTNLDPSHTAPANRFTITTRATSCMQ